MSGARGSWKSYGRIGDEGRLPTSLLVLYVYAP